MRSAIFNRMLERSVIDFFAQLSLAAWAASNARLISSDVERGISQNSSPVTGLVFLKYSPLTGATQSPLI